MISKIVIYNKDNIIERKLNQTIIFTNTNVIHSLLDLYIHNKINQVELIEYIMKELYVKGCEIIQSDTFLTFETICNQLEMNNYGIIVNDVNKFSENFSSYSFQYKNFLIFPLSKGKFLYAHSKSGFFTYTDIFRVYPLLYALSKLNSECNEFIKNKPIDDIDNLKHAFLAMISHEIRTPLNGIIGITQLLSEIEHTERERQYIHILNECSIQLMTLINDILDFSKLNSHQLALTPYTFSLNKCIYNAINMIQVKANEKQIPIYLNVIKPLPLKLLGDERRITQILINLLTNSIKFTETGYISITVHYEIIQNMYKIYFEVKDTGIGIPVYDIENIFQMFNTVYHGNSTHNNNKGTGLGLAITKYLIELMNGSIHVENNKENGCTFYFHIFLENDELNERFLEDYDVFYNKVVGIVDDDLTDRSFLMKTLQEWKMKVNLFNSINELNIFLKSNSNKVDILIINVHIYSFENIELVTDDILIIGLKTNSMYECSLNMFQTILYKPISRSTLFNTLFQLFNEYIKTNDKLENKNLFPLTEKNNFKNINLNKSFNAYKIIIAEDDMFNQLLLKEFLLLYGFDNSQINIVSNGQECIDAFQNENYDLCFMDIKMPIVDGLEATKEIQKTNSTTIFIAVSASILESEHNKCFQNGMHYFIEKPIQKSKLIELLNNIIKNK